MVHASPAGSTLQCCLLAFIFFNLHPGRFDAV